MTHLWIRAEERANERRVGVTPDGVVQLQAAGIRVTVEDSATRIIPTADFAATGAAIVDPGTWVEAPRDAIILGLKELPANSGPLPHTHILFGHAFKGQPDGPDLLRRFKTGGGALLDLEYLTDPNGRRVAAFGYWAGYVGAALSVLAWAAQRSGLAMGSVDDWPTQDALLAEVKDALPDALPTAIIIGALGRTGSGAAALLEALGVTATAWDMAETAHGGPFPEILGHDIFLNCILAMPGVPVFVPQSAVTAPRNLTVIGDIACDPDSDYSPIKVYDRTTTWADPIVHVAQETPLDVMAIDNLPSLLPLESSHDFAGQLLPHLLRLPEIDSGVWARAGATYRDALKAL